METQTKTNKLQLCVAVTRNIHDDIQTQLWTQVLRILINRPEKVLTNNHNFQKCRDPFYTIICELESGCYVAQYVSSEEDVIDRFYLVCASISIAKDVYRDMRYIQIISGTLHMISDIPIQTPIMFKVI